MSMKRMAARTHGEGIQRRRIAATKVDATQARRWLVQRVDIRIMSMLPRDGACDQCIARADAELRDQRHLDGQSTRMGRKAHAGKSFNRLGGCEHGAVPCGWLSTM